MTKNENVCSSLLSCEQVKRYYNICSRNIRYLGTYLTVKTLIIFVFDFAVNESMVHLGQIFNRGESGKKCKLTRVNRINRFACTNHL